MATWKRKRFAATRATVTAAAAQGVARAGGFMVDLAQQLCPVDSGDLRASIRLEPSEPALRMEVKAGGGAVDYAPFVEYGTAASPAQPFLTPAVKRIKVRKEVAAELRKALKR